MKENRLDKKFFYTNNIGLDYYYLNKYSKNNNLSYIETLMYIEQLILLRSYNYTNILFSKYNGSYI